MIPFAARVRAETHRSERSPIYRLAVVVVTFAAVTAIWFAPLLGSFGHSLLTTRGGGDAGNYIRDVWGIRHAHATPFTYDRDRLNGAPEGLPESPAIAIASPVQPLFTMATVPLLGLVASFNLFVLLGFVATAAAAFEFLDWLGFGFLPSILGAYVIAFNPWTFNRAAEGAPAFLHGWCLILLLYTLTRLREVPTLRAAASAGLAFALCFLVAAYVGLIACAFLAAFVVVELVHRSRSGGVLAFVKPLAVLAGAAVVPLLPALVEYVRTQSAVDRQLGNPLVEAVRGAAEPFTSYLLPSPLHPVIGGLGAGLRPAGGLGERVVFFGYSTIALAVVGVVLLLRDSDSRMQRRARAALWMAAAAVPIAYYSSLPRFIHLDGVELPTGSYLISSLTTFYRFYARFGYAVGIALAILAASALGRIERVTRGRLAALLIGTLMVFELLPGPLPTAAANIVSPADRWLSTQPAGIVAHYPMPTDSNLALRLAGHEYQMTRFTGQPLFTLFGAGIGETREEAIRILCRYLTDPGTPAILAAEGVRYVVVHDDVYIAEGTRVPHVPPPLRLVKRFRGVRIYALPADATKADISQVLEQRAAEVAGVEGLRRPSIHYDAAFHLVARHGNGAGWHTLTGRGTISFRNDDPRLRRSSFTLDAQASERPRTLDLIDSRGAVLQRFQIGTEITSVQLGPFPTPTGTTRYVLTTEDHATKGWDVVLSPGVLQPLADYSVSLAG